VPEAQGHAAPTATDTPLGRARVGWGFVILYALAYTGTCLLFLAPILVSLALKVNDLVGIDQAPAGLALIASVGALAAMVANPLFGRLSDRTTSGLGRRRPWMLAGLAVGSVAMLGVAVAPTIGLVLAGWCVAQLAFNAILAAMVAVLPDQVPAEQRGVVSGILGVCVPIASVAGTFLVKVFAPDLLGMFAMPCLVAAVAIVTFAAVLDDRPHAAADRPAWSLRELARTFYVNPRRNPDFGWAFASRFLFVLAYAFLLTYQAYYLLAQLGSAQDDLPQQIFIGTAVQSAVIVAASLAGGAVSDRTGRRKVFVAGAAVVYGLALFVLAAATEFNGYLAGMAVSGLGFGLYMAVDLALVVDVLPDGDSAAKDLGVLNIAGALPTSVAPALAPAVLAVSGGSYAALFVVAGACGLLAATAILPVRRAR
jgi:MFS family permease